MKLVVAGIPAGHALLALLTDVQCDLSLIFH